MSSQTQKWVPGAKEFFVCQTFAYQDRGEQQGLVQFEMHHLPDLRSATVRAERSLNLNNIVGAIAYRITVDEEMGEYSEMLDVTSFGDVPNS